MERLMSRIGWLMSRALVVSVLCAVAPSLVLAQGSGQGDDIDGLLGGGESIDPARDGQDQTAAGNEEEGSEAEDAREEEQAAPKARGRVLEEITVTAQRREESIRDVPISIQAFSPDALEARGVSDTTDLMKVVPGLNMGTQAGDFTSVFLRGIGTEAWLNSDPSVATYLDGVYYPFSPSVAQDLLGIERVEVLKGPQGTLFGRNAVGGAIDVKLKQPQFDSRETTMSTQYDSFNDGRRVDVFTNIPLTKNVASNVAMFYSYDETGWSDDSTVGGEPVPPNKKIGMRTKLRWQPTDRLDLGLTGFFFKRDGTSTLAAPINATPLGRVIGRDAQEEQEARNRKVNPDLPIFGHLESKVLSTENSYAGEWVDIELLASRQLHSNPYNYDYDGTEFPGASFIVERHKSVVNQAELRFISNAGSWGADWLDVVGGLYFFENEAGFDPVELTVGGINPDILTDQLQFLVDLPPIITDTIDGVGAVLNPILNDVIGSQPLYALKNNGEQETSSYSAYFQVAADLTDWMTLTLGLRYQNEDRGIKASDTALRIGNVAEVMVFDWQQARDQDGNPRPQTDVTEEFAPKVGLDFTPFADDTLFYVTYQEAVKAHSFNAFAFYLRPAYAAPEYMTSYEAGLKRTFFQGTTRFEFALFRYETENLQTQAISLLNGGAVSIDTAGDALTKGFDFDVIADVFPSIFGGNLSFTINGAYLDAVYKSYPDGQGQDPDTGIFTPNNDYTGNRITRSPKLSGSANLSYTWLVPGGNLETGVNYYYNDGFFYSAANIERFSQPSYSLIGANLSYLHERSNVRVSLIGDNLTDEFYTAGMLKLDFGAMASLGRDRSFKLKIDWTF